MKIHHAIATIALALVIGYLAVHDTQDASAIAPGATSTPAHSGTIADTFDRKVLEVLVPGVEAEISCGQPRESNLRNAVSYIVRLKGGAKGMSGRLIATDQWGNVRWNDSMSVRRHHASTTTIPVDATPHSRPARHYWGDYHRVSFRLSDGTTVPLADRFCAIYNDPGPHAR